MDVPNEILYEVCAVLTQKTEIKHAHGKKGIVMSAAVED
jgi:hypothetical protein